MRPRSRALRIASAMAAGATFALAAEVGGSLLLYGGAGALRAGGALLAVTLAALAGGYWAGRSDHRNGNGPPSTSHWFLAALALAIAAAFTGWWLNAHVRQQAVWQAVAVVVLMGGPAYTLGSLLAVLQERSEAERPDRRGGVIVPALAGGALAAVLGAVIVPRVGGVLVLFDSALLLGLVGATESRAGAGPVAGPNPSDRKGLMDRVALVTGVGSKGQVGYAVARALLEAGARVVVTGHQESVQSLADELGRELNAADRVAVRAADLTRQGDVAALMALARERFGRLDAVVNVAGGLSVMKRTADTTDEEWQREMRRNAETTFMVSREALPLLREHGGAIVNFASPAGLSGGAGVAAYSGAKAAVIALTHSLAQEEAEHGIRVNAIAPGMIDTEQNRQAVSDPEQVKWVTREQIADAVVFLVSDRASGISGETVKVLGEGVKA